MSATAFGQWFAGELPQAVEAAGLLPRAPWTVTNVLITEAAASAVGLSLPPRRALALSLPGGGSARVRSLGAVGPDVWVELARDVDRELVFLPLTWGLGQEAATVYRTLRTQGYAPDRARLVAFLTGLPTEGGPA